MIVELDYSRVGDQIGADLQIEFGAAVPGKPHHSLLRGNEAFKIYGQAKSDCAEEIIDKSDKIPKKKSFWKFSLFVKKWILTLEQ